MRFIATILLLFTLFQFFAQELPTTLERSEMLIGEVNTIIIQHNGALKADDVPYLKSIAAKSTQTSEQAESIEIEVYGVQYASQELRIQFTIWDSAVVVLPPFAVNSSGSLTSQALMFQVNFPRIDENGDIADIYEIVVEANELSEIFAKFWWLIDLLVVALFIVGLILVLNINQTEEQIEPIIQLAPDKRAIKDLESLMQRRLFTENQKLHFAEFSDILRRYIGLHYTFITFEKTTHEILNHMRSNKIEHQLVEEFGSLLHLADMIKFSKATTDEIEIERSYNAARVLIVETTRRRESQKLDANQSADQAGSQSPETKKGEGDV
jgi:hypothetical protein